MLALLIGCALRRQELATLTVEDIQMRENRWVIADLRGKGNRVRTVAVPLWVKNGINAWQTAAGIEDGRLFRSVRKGGRVGESLSDWAVWSVVTEAAREIGIENFGAHDVSFVTLDGTLLIWLFGTPAFGSGIGTSYWTASAFVCLHLLSFSRSGLKRSVPFSANRTRPIIRKTTGSLSLNYIPNCILVSLERFELQHPACEPCHLPRCPPQPEGWGVATCSQ